MSRACDDVVRAAIALHLEVEPEKIRPSARLSEDLGLDPLDLVLVTLRIEEVMEAELPIDELEGIETVAQLQAIVRSWTRARPTDAELDTREPRARTTSSVGLRLGVGARRRVGM